METMERYYQTKLFSAAHTRLDHFVLITLTRWSVRTLTMFFRQCGYAPAISVKILDHHCPPLLDPQLGWEPVQGHCSCKGFMMALHFVLSRKSSLSFLVSCDLFVVGLAAEPAGCSVGGSNVLG